MKLNLYTTAQILDSLPEELWYSKNIGLWSIRTAEDEILLYQKNREPFEDFVRDFAQRLIDGKTSLGEDGRDTFLLNLASIELMDLFNVK